MKRVLTDIMSLSGESREDSHAGVERVGERRERVLAWGVLGG